MKCAYITSYTFFVSLFFVYTVEDFTTIMYQSKFLHVFFAVAMYFSGSAVTQGSKFVATFIAYFDDIPL